MIPCLVKGFLGYDCPGCGIQRSFWALTEGKLWESVVMFPALLIYLGLIGLLFLSVVLKLNISYKWFVSTALIAITVQLGYYALRMTGVIHVDCYFN